MNIVHVGLPKTGTTTLQHAVFPAQHQFTYIGKINNCYPRDLQELVERISFQDSLEYDPARAAALAARLHDGSKPLIVSDEIFSVDGKVDRRLVAERLHRLFGPAKVLIGLRAQPSMLQALYFNYIRGSGRRVMSFSAWLEENYGHIRFPGTYRTGLNYEPLVRAYEDVFGADNVIVLPFELMRDLNSIFATTLADMIGMPLAELQAKLASNFYNQRMSARRLLAIRFENVFPVGTNLALLGRRLLPLSIYEPVRHFVNSGRRLASPDLPDGWLARVAAECAQGNAAIEARKKVPLRALGYPVEPPEAKPTAAEANGRKRVGADAA
jgi:hypothetical protein